MHGLRALFVDFFFGGFFVIFIHLEPQFASVLPCSHFGDEGAGCVWLVSQRLFHLWGAHGGCAQEIIDIILIESVRSFDWRPGG